AALHYWAKRFRVENLRPEISQLGGLAIGDLRDRTGFRHQPWIGGQETRHVAPDNDFVGIESRAEYGCRIIGPTATERSKYTFFACTDEASHHRHDASLQERSYTGLAARAGQVNPRLGSAMIGIGHDQFGRIHRLAGDSDF